MSQMEPMKMLPPTVAKEETPLGLQPDGTFTAVVTLNRDQVLALIQAKWGAMRNGGVTREIASDYLASKLAAAVEQVGPSCEAAAALLENWFES